MALVVGCSGFVLGPFSRRFGWSPSSGGSVVGFRNEIAFVVVEGGGGGGGGGTEGVFRPKLVEKRRAVAVMAKKEGGVPDEDDLPDRLPASYRSDNGTRDSEFNLEPLPREISAKNSTDSTAASSLSTEITNPYVAVVANLSPSDLIGRFMSTANPKVQEAVRTTILGLIGSLPKMAFETTTMTTGERLASLMFQLQMTGYMFKNAEYRMSLTRSLKGVSSLPQASEASAEASAFETGSQGQPSSTVVSGKIKVKYEGGMEVEVDADAYMSELRDEVSKLKDQLATTREAKEEAVQADMLSYIRSLPEQQMRSLTDTMTPTVLDAMKQLVDTVLTGVGDGEIGPETVTEQSGSAMAQLCMWQLVVGYNLRELEVRDEMERNINGK